jgi:tight adherence protein C
MPPALLAAVIFVVLASALFLMGMASFTSTGAGAERLRHYLGLEARPRSSLGDRLDKALAPAAKLLPPSAQEVSRTRAWLMQAGYREPRHLRIFFSLRAVLVFVPLIVVLVTGFATRAPLMLVVAPALGFMLPRFWLKRRMAQRAHRIELSLPDTLDLLVVCVEAGLGLDQAIQRVAHELKLMHPDLCGEFELLGLELHAGVPRREALQHLGERCAVDDLRTLCAALIQTERFGTSVAHALRVHSQALRTERRQRLEEQAAKLSIKMLPVLALFVFPAVMIVVIGPAAISLIRHFGPLLR